MSANGSTEKIIDPVPRRRVVAGVFVTPGAAADPRVLLTLRDGRSDYENHWECPGGKVEPGETDVTALDRELREELGIIARIDPRPLGQVALDPPLTKQPYLVTFYCARITFGRPFPRQAKALGLFSLADLVRLPLMPANLALRPVVEAFMQSDLWRRT